MNCAIQQETRLKSVSCELRRATAGDRDAIAAMYRSFEPKGAALGLPPRKDPEAWLDQLAEYRNFVVFLDGQLAGHAVLCPHDLTGEVGVFVHQDYRSRGLGKLLLGELISEARRLGLESIWGIAETDNLHMLRLAFRLGFLPGEHAGEFYLDLCEETALPKGCDLAA